MFNAPFPCAYNATMRDWLAVNLTQSITFFVQWNYIDFSTFLVIFPDFMNVEVFSALVHLIFMHIFLTPNSMPHQVQLLSICLSLYFFSFYFPKTKILDLFGDSCTNFPVASCHSSVKSDWNLVSSCVAVPKSLFSSSLIISLPTFHVHESLISLSHLKRMAFSYIKVQIFKPSQVPIELELTSMDSAFTMTQFSLREYLLMRLKATPAVPHDPAVALTLPSLPLQATLFFMSCSRAVRQGTRDLKNPDLCTSSQVSAYVHGERICLPKPVHQKAP